MIDIIEREASVTTKGQVTIPVEVRKKLGLKEEGGPVVFTYKDGVVTIRSAYKTTLTELLASFDPAKHRHAAEERTWDDPPRGRESI